jgi:hypothetical protein
MKAAELIKTGKLNLPKSNEFLWRYFDIHKFLSFLQNKTFRFTRMDQFEDPLEGIPLSALTLYDEKLAHNLIPENISLSELILDPSLFPKLPPALLDKLRKIHSTHRSTFVSCWFYEQRESMAMWNLYSNADGVALKIPFGKLKAQLLLPGTSKNISAYYAGRIDYQNFQKVDSYADNLSKVPKVALRKDSSFSHEKEFRFIVRSSNTNDDIIGIDSKPINLSTIGLNVVCHPRMISWKKTNIQNILKKARLPNAFRESEIKLR